MKPLDDRTLEALADLICGDGQPWRRTWHEIFLLLTDAGFPPMDILFSSRRRTALTALSRHADDPELMGNVVAQLADPSEYADKPGAAGEVLKRLRRIFADAGIGGRP